MLIMYKYQCLGSVRICQNFTPNSNRNNSQNTIDIERTTNMNVYVHTMMKTPVLVRSRKLSIIGTG